MTLFTQIQLRTYIKRIELQKDILSLSTVFNKKQKTEIDAIYKELLSICKEAYSLNLDVSEPTYL